MPPLTTIVSPCYNHARYIVEHLDSVRAQDYPDIQHIIIDDGSSDGSPDIIQKWIDDNSHECVFIRHEKNRGLCNTLNEAIAISEGEYWTAFGTDDVMLPHRTRVLAEYLEAHPECMVVSADSQLIDLDSKPAEFDGYRTMLAWSMRGQPDFDWRKDYGNYEWMMRQNHLPLPVLRTEVFAKYGGFDPEFKLEDWEMWMRVVEHSRPVFIDEIVAYYRLHPTNTSKDATMMQEQCMLTFLKHYEQNMRLCPEWSDRLLRIHFNACVINPKRPLNVKYFLRSAFVPMMIGETLRWMRNVLVTNGFRLL